MSNDSFLSRRSFIRIGGAAVLGAELLRAGGSSFYIPEARAADVTSPMTSDEALKALMDGNKRFINSMNESCMQSTLEHRMKVAEGQNPFAVILACADSRVPPEIIFDQWIGDLFVVRVAGNIITPSNYGILGSIEYGVKALGVNLIMVLGHSRCGAVDSAIKAIKDGTKFPGSIETIVQAIKPSVERAKGEPGDLLHNAILDNVRLGVSRISGSDPVVAPMVKEGKVKVVGGNYDLVTGEVTLVT
ncbi:MAG TPA: carbonic anhydrase [Thermodesulfobacteriota bacterium]|nr:carbonic anhydrase [Thermodesulfobacteriota bacterium]